MQRLALEGNQKALVVVAHPDDETIWMGGTIARFKNFEWTIFVLCRESDPDRMPKFLKVANYYNAKGIICDLEDEGIMNIEESVPRIGDIIRKRLSQKQFDYIFTHGPSGDYGHPRHIGVNRAVTDMIQAKELYAKNVIYFAYVKMPDLAYATPDLNAKFLIQLSHREWKAKRDIIKRLYGFSKLSFENRSCSMMETFNN